MTDKDIIEALEYCIKYEECAECPCVKSQTKCVANNMEKIVDLIKHQQAEIENYSHNTRSLTESVTEMQKALKKQSAEIERLEKQFNSKYKWENMLDKKIKEIKAEAIKEFAERLKDNFPYKNACYTFEGIEYRIDNLVKEMVGDAE